MFREIGFTVLMIWLSVSWIYFWVYIIPKLHQLIRLITKKEKGRYWKISFPNISFKECMINPLYKYYETKI